jgi:hypothetical protein
VPDVQTHFSNRFFALLNRKNRENNKKISGYLAKKIQKSEFVKINTKIIVQIAMQKRYLTFGNWKIIIKKNGRNMTIRRIT